MRTSVVDRNGALQGRGDRLNAGFLRIYAGPVPLSPEDSVGAAVLIAQCALGNPACASPSAGTMAFNTIGSTTCVGTGSPTFARFVRFDGTSVVADMDIPTELVLSKSSWTSGEAFPGPAVTWSQAPE